MTVDNETVLSVLDLRKRFVLHGVDGRVVEGLRGVNLDVRRGEHVALAGSSGAGKSTLLKCIHRTYLPDGGCIRYQRSGTGEVVDLVRLPDRPMADLRELEIGYVSQFLRTEPRRGVLDVVARAAERGGLGHDEARDAAATVLRRVNIAEALWATYPTMLSGGEKQRVNVAAGIVRPPALLLLDEPVSALDPGNRADALDLIADMTAGGTTVVSVFHDLDAMARLADRIVVMADGQIVGDGEPSEMLPLLRRRAA